MRRFQVVNFGLLLPLAWAFCSAAVMKHAPATVCEATVPGLHVSMRRCGSVEGAAVHVAPTVAGVAVNPAELFCAGGDAMPCLVVKLVVL